MDWNAQIEEGAQQFETVTTRLSGEIERWDAMLRGKRGIVPAEVGVDGHNCSGDLRVMRDPKGEWRLAFHDVGYSEPKWLTECPVAVKIACAAAIPKLMAEIVKVRQRMTKDAEAAIKALASGE